MVLPAANLNYPLAIFAIFLRRVIDKFRKVPKNAILKKSIWYSCYMLSQEQWPVLVAALAVSCTLARFYRSNASTAIVSMAKNKAGALNNSLRRRQWLQRRRSWLKQFNMRKTKDAPLKLGVSNLITQMRNKPSFQDVSERCSFNQIGNFSCSCTRPKNTDKATYIGPSPSFNKFSQTEENVSLDAHVHQMQNLRKSFSEISLISNNNDSRASSIHNEQGCLREVGVDKPSWAPSPYPKGYDNLDEDMLKNNCDHEATKYMEPMCQILPMGCVPFSDFVKEDDNKSDDDLQSEGNPKNQTHKKKKKKKKVVFSRKKRLYSVRPKLKLHGTTSDSHLIRKTRSGRIYGYSEKK